MRVLGTERYSYRAGLLQHLYKVFVVIVVKLVVLWLKVLCESEEDAGSEPTPSSDQRTEAASRRCTR